MRPLILKPGDVLLYRDGGDFLGHIIQWAEWIDGHGVDSYVHAALYYGPRGGNPHDDPGQWIVRQNPGGPAFELAASQPWDRIDVYREMLGGGTMCPADVAAWIPAFQKVVQNHYLDNYGYGEIGDYLGEDLLSRLGLGQVTSELRKKAAVFLQNHTEVCSEFARQILQETTDAAIGTERFDLLPGIGGGQGRPADFPESRFLVKVAA